MGLDVLNKKVHDFEKKIEPPEIYPDISNLIIPLSLIFKSYHPPDIYTGEEIIPFKERDMQFKRILIQEFLNE